MEKIKEKRATPEQIESIANILHGRIMFANLMIEIANGNEAVIEEQRMEIARCQSSLQFLKETVRV